MKNCTDDHDRLDELWHRAQIYDVLMNYCRGVDRKHTKLMRSVFHDDALVENGPYRGDPDGFVAWVMENHVHTEQSMHVIANCLIERNGPIAIAESYCIGHQRHSPAARGARKRFTLDAPDTEEPLRVVASLRWVDRFELRDDVWRIAHRQVVMENAYAHFVPAFEPDAHTPGAKWLLQVRDPVTDPLWAARQKAGLDESSL